MDMEFDNYTIAGIVLALLLAVGAYFYWGRKTLTKSSQSDNDSNSDASSDDGKNNCDGNMCYR